MQPHPDREEPLDGAVPEEGPEEGATNEPRSEGEGGSPSGGPMRGPETPDDGSPGPDQAPIDTSPSEADPQSRPVDPGPGDGRPVPRHPGPMAPPAGATGPRYPMPGPPGAGPTGPTGAGPTGPMPGPSGPMPGAPRPMPGRPGPMRPPVPPRGPLRRGPPPAGPPPAGSLPPGAFARPAAPPAWFPPERVEGPTAPEAPRLSGVAGPASSTPPLGSTAPPGATPRAARGATTPAPAPVPPETHADPDPSDALAHERHAETEAAVEEPASSDWLDRICPYLLSEDGTSRSAQPDPRHRCMAQEPPATLPLLFQERFCLTDRHVRCEMYKQAEGARSMALAQDSIPAEQVRSARFRPSVRSRPIALEPDSTGAVASKANPFAARPVAFGVLGAAGLAIVLMALAILFGGFGSPPPGDASPSAPLTTLRPVPTSTPTTRPTATPEGPQATGIAGSPILIRYELQEGERVLRVAEKWGISRFAIVQANPDGDPREARAGDVIIVPVPPGTPADAIEATPGFLGYVEE